MWDDLSAAHERIDQWESSLAERVARASELSNRTAALTGTARDREGLAEVTVDSTGAMSHLWLSEAVRHRRAAEISELVLSTMRSAQAQLAESVTEATVAAYGPDSPATSAILANIQRRFGSGTASGTDAGDGRAAR